MSSLKTILITGATGKQGGALLNSLLEANKPTPQFSIIALTRSLASPTSQHLATLPNVTTLQGNLDDTPAIFAQITTPIYGVFSVQTPMKPALEEAQGKALVDAAIAANVSHFVYASVERGGDVKSDTTPTIVPHFISKFNIEAHLKAQTEKAGVNMTWTIIRPVAFMENFTRDFIGKGTPSMWRLNGEDSRLQLVSVVDVGRLGALAFRKPEEFKSRSISLAGDELSWKEMDAVFRRVTGAPVPVMYGFMARLLRWVMWEQLGIMFVWFGTDGYGADIEGVRRVLPGLLSLEEWLKTESQYKELVAGK